MLNQLRRRAINLLTAPAVCTLATAGPAGVQAAHVRCAGQGLHLYLWLPDTSEHLLNLETPVEVVVLTDTWHLRGTARCLPLPANLPGLSPPPWHILVEVTPYRLQFTPAPGRPAETIDFDILELKTGWSCL